MNIRSDQPRHAVSGLSVLFAIGGLAWFSAAAYAGAEGVENAVSYIALGWSTILTCCPPPESKNSSNKDTGRSVRFHKHHRHHDTNYLDLEPYWLTRNPRS